MHILAATCVVTNLDGPIQELFIGSLTYNDQTAGISYKFPTFPLHCCSFLFELLPYTLSVDSCTKDDAAADDNSMNDSVVKDSHYYLYQCSLEEWSCTVFRLAVYGTPYAEVVHLVRFLRN